MTGAQDDLRKTDATRKPRVFEVDDPALTLPPSAPEPEPEPSSGAGRASAAEGVEAPPQTATPAPRRSGIRWAAIPRATAITLTSAGRIVSPRYTVRLTRSTGSADVTDMNRNAVERPPSATASTPASSQRGFRRSRTRGRGWSGVGGVIFVILGVRWRNRLYDSRPTIPPSKTGICG